jgi:hypothetical protein
VRCLEATRTRALGIVRVSYKRIASILGKGLDGRPLHGVEHIDADKAPILGFIGGDHAQFLRAHDVEWARQVVDGVLSLWATERDTIRTHPAGSSDPAEADRLFDKQHQRRSALRAEDVRCRDAGSGADTGRANLRLHARTTV